MFLKSRINLNINERKVLTQARLLTKLLVANSWIRNQFQNISNKACSSNIDMFESSGFIKTECAPIDQPKALIF